MHARAHAHAQLCCKKATLIYSDIQYYILPSLLNTSGQGRVSFEMERLPILAKYVGAAIMLERLPAHACRLQSRPKECKDEEAEDEGKANQKKVKRGEEDQEKKVNNSQQPDSSSGGLRIAFVCVTCMAVDRFWWHILGAAFRSSIFVFLTVIFLPL